MLKKILSYSVGLYAVSLLGSLLRIVVKSFIAKNIGKEALGAYAFYMTVMMLGVSLLAFGLRRAVTRYASASKDEKDFAPVVMAIIAIGITASLLLAGLGLLLSPAIDWIYVLVLVSVGSFTLYDVVRSTLRGQFDQKREIFFAFLAIFLQTGCVIVFVAFIDNMRAPVWGMTLANILLAVVTIAYFLWRYQHKWRPSQLWNVVRSAEFRGLVLLAAPLWVTEILQIIGTQFDQFIVQGQLGYATLAEYAAAFTFIGILDQPITVMSRVFLVTFSGGFYSDIDQYKRVSSVSMAFFSLLGLSVVAVSGPLTPVLFTNEYSLVPLLVSILSVSSIFNSVEVLNSSLTIAIEYPQANRNSKIWTTVLYIPLAFFLVSRFGVIGAAWSYVVSWGCYAITHAFYMRSRLPQHAAFTFRTLLLGAGMYVGVITITWFIPGTWLVILLAPVYLVFGHILRLWNLSEIPLLVQQLLPQRFMNLSVFMSKKQLQSKEQ